MNTSMNRNRWGVSAKALEEGAPTIKGTPIGSGKGYRTDDHYPEGETIDVGEFSSWEIPGSYMTATASIPDDTAWGKLKAGDWGPISVVLDSFNRHCSKCGQDLMMENWREHEHIAKNQAYMVVDSFKFFRVDFVDKPAYPQAGVLDVTASGDLSPIITLAAGYYQGSYSTDGGGAGTPESRRKKEKNLMTLEELQAKLEEKENEIKALQEKVKGIDAIKTELEELKAAADDNDDDDPKEDPKVKELTERLDKLDAERHDDLVVTCADARFKAGLATDLDQEKERLKAFTDPYLVTLTGDAEEYMKKLKAAQPPRRPKANYDDDGDELSEFDEAFKKVKARLFPKHVQESLKAQMTRPGVAE